MIVVKMMDDANEQFLRWITRAQDKRVKKVLWKDLKGIHQALVNIGKLRIYMDALTQETKIDPQAAIKNPVFNLLSKEDGLFKWFLYNMESVKTGREIEELLLDKEVRKRVDSYIFADTGKFVRWFLQGVNDFPLLKFFFPFVRTPFNMTAELIKRMAPLFPSRWTYEGFAKSLTFWQLVALAVAVGDGLQDAMKKIEGFGQAIDGLSKIIQAKLKGDKRAEYFALKEFKKNMQMSTTIGSVYKAIQIITHFQFERAFRNIVRGFIPNVLRRQALASYPYAVKTPTIIDLLASTVPGFRSNLPKRKKYGDYLKLDVDNPIEALFSMYVEPEWTPKQKAAKKYWEEMAWRRELLKRLKRRLQ